MNVDTTTNWGLLVQWVADTTHWSTVAATIWLQVILLALFVFFLVIVASNAHDRDPDRDASFDTWERGMDT